MATHYYLQLHSVDQTIQAVQMLEEIFEIPQINWFVSDRPISEMMKSGIIRGQLRDEQAASDENSVKMDAMSRTLDKNSQMLNTEIDRRIEAVRRADQLRAELSSESALLVTAQDEALDAHQKVRGLVEAVRILAELAGRT